MKRLLLSLMILSIVLTLSVSCTTSSEIPRIIIPEFAVAKPVRPILDRIPIEPSGAVRTLTENLSKLSWYIDQIEAYLGFQTTYYAVVLEIIAR